MIYLVKTPKCLRIIPTDVEGLRREVSASCQIEEFLGEYLAGTEWEIIQPEEVGALTSGLLLSDDVLRDDNGDLVKIGCVYWDSDYQVQDALAELRAGRTVEFVASDPDPEP